VVGYWGTAFISVGVIVSVLGGLATFYTVFLVFAAGLDFTLLSFIIYAPGTSCSSCPGASTAAPSPGRS
jgi:hypothetical protein